MCTQSYYLVVVLQGTSLWNVFRLWHLSFILQFSKKYICWPQKPPTENSTWVFMILSKKFFFQNTKLKYFSPQIIEFKNQDNSEVLNSDFPGLINHCSLIDFSGLCNLIGLNSLIFSKNILILMIWSSMASNWPVLLIFLWNGSSKIWTFANIWHCRRLLRPAYVTFLKIGQ